MFLKDNILYAGITTEKGLELILNGVASHTGMLLQRITDGKILGVSYELLPYEKPSMFIEIDADIPDSYLEKNRVIIAGVYNEEGFDLCLNKEDLFTGKKFLRIHDGFEIGNRIYLGIDYSYDKNGRYDLQKYYVEVEDLENE